MKTLTIVCGMKCDLSNIKGDVLGVDRGALYCAQNNIKMIAAMGDFDSVTSEEKELIENNCSNIIKFNPIKDDTDSEAAIHFAENNGYENALMYGALGGRQDHNFLNIKLLSLSKIPLTLIDDKHKMYVLKEGEHLINKDNYKYISLFPYVDTALTLVGCFYPLTNTTVKTTDLYTISNEILEDSCKLIIHNGELLIIQCND